MANRARFPKPIQLYGVLDLYGRNVVTTEGEDWRIHRRITGPSFSEVRPLTTPFEEPASLTVLKSSNRLVCEETVLAMEGLFEMWKGKNTIQYDDFSEVTMQVRVDVPMFFSIDHASVYSLHS